MQGRNVLENCFEFYTMLATSFSLTNRHAQQRGERRYARTFITLLTPLTIHVFKVEKFLVPFIRVSLRALYPKRFLCYSTVFSAI